MRELLVAHISDNKYKSVDWYQFLAWLEEKVFELFPTSFTSKWNKLLVKDWVYGIGRPPVTLNFSTPTLDDADKLVKDYIDGKGDKSPDNYQRYFDYIPILKAVFASKLLENTKSINLKIVQKIDDDLKLSDSLSPSIKYVWYQTGINAGYEKVKPLTQTFLCSIGW